MLTRVMQLPVSPCSLPSPLPNFRIEMLREDSFAICVILTDSQRTFFKSSYSVIHNLCRYTATKKLLYLDSRLVVAMLYIHMQLAKWKWNYWVATSQAIYSHYFLVKTTAVVTKSHLVSSSVSILSCWIQSLPPPCCNQLTLTMDLTNLKKLGIDLKYCLKRMEGTIYFYRLLNQLLFACIVRVSYDLLHMCLIVFNIIEFDRCTWYQQLQ